MSYSGTVINKVVQGANKAVSDVFDGATILIGGFGQRGECPSYLIAAIARKGVKNLTISGQNAGRPRPKILTLEETAAAPISDYCPSGFLVERGQVSKAIMAFAAVQRHNVFSALEEGAMDGSIELELCPQGTIMERIRAARAGIGAFYTPTGVGSRIADGKEQREINGRPQLLEYALHGDFSLVRAHQADRYGNLVYSKAMRSLNADVAGASTVTIAEVDEVVDYLDPDAIVTPAVYVTRVVVRPKTPLRWDTPF